MRRNIPRLNPYSFDTLRKTRLCKQDRANVRYRTFVDDSGARRRDPSRNLQQTRKASIALADTGACARDANARKLPAVRRINRIPSFSNSPEAAIEYAHCERFPIRQ